jgi:sulfatase maturation enzyme AslB (radical SAM superfamily)
MTWNDRTYCATPDCHNECGRKMSDKEIAQQKAFFAAQGYSIPVSYAYFCGEPLIDEPQKEPKPSKPM